MAVFIAIVGAVAGAVAGSVARRRDEKDRHTGERIGALERFKDFERGRRAGLREGRKQRGSNDR